jgi:hypothetical protein
MTYNLSYRMLWSLTREKFPTSKVSCTIRVTIQRTCGPQVFSQDPEDRPTGTGCQFHLTPSWWEVRYYTLARHRIERVLQVVCDSQEAA